MLTRRLIIGRSLVGYLLAGCIVSLSTSVTQIEGRKCVCTSKACKEAGIDTCRTRFFCYTELIVTTRQEIGESTITRGCTEGATPLLCETKSWVTRSRSVNAMELSTSPRALVPWPRLKCCNSHDYCNANDDDDDDDEENASTWKHERKIQVDQTYSTINRETLMDYLTSTNRHTMLTLQPDRNYEDSIESTNRLLQNRIKALHVAALVLAVAVLISVLASSYVITRNNRYRGKREKSEKATSPVTNDLEMRDLTYLSVWIANGGPCSSNSLVGAPRGAINHSMSARTARTARSARSARCPGPPPLRLFQRN